MTDVGELTCGIQTWPFLDGREVSLVVWSAFLFIPDTAFCTQDGLHQVREGCGAEQVSSGGVDDMFEPSRGSSKLGGNQQRMWTQLSATFDHRNTTFV